MSVAPQAQLFIATGCQHCPAVLQALAELLKNGDISSLEAINIQQAPERAAELNIRSVPWLRLGPFELTGLRSKQELKQWIKRINEPEAMADYFAELITSGEMTRVYEMVEENPEYFTQLVELMGNQDTTLSVRIGVGAVIEEFTGDDLLIQNIDLIGKHTHDADARIRNDACYYLGLSRSPLATQYIKPLLDDDDADVRETAEDALDEIRSH